MTAIETTPLAPGEAGEPPVVRRAAGTTRATVPGRPLLMGLASVVAALIIALLAVTVFLSLRRGNSGTHLWPRYYTDIVHDRSAYRALLNTIGFAAVTLVVSLGLGVPLAWVTERTDLPGKSRLYSFLTAGLLIPGFFFGIAWTFLFDPYIGVLNKLIAEWLSLSRGPINISNLPGMGFVEGLALAPLAFIMTAASIRAMDPTLEEAAQTSGAGRWTTLRKVTLRLAFPGILGAAIFIFTIALSAFDIPLIIGQSHRILTFSTYLFEKMNPNQASSEVGYGPAAAFSTFMMAIALLLAWWYTRVLSRSRRYQVVSGRGYRPRLIPLGRWRFLVWGLLGLYFGFGIVATLAVTVWTAIQPFAGQAPSLSALHHATFANFRHLPWPDVRRDAGHTAVLLIVVPTISLALSVAFSWVVLRSRSRLRLAYDFLAFLPQAVPGVIFAFAAFVGALFLLPSFFPSDFYRSLTLLGIVMILVYLAFGSRVTNGAMIQIHPELEEAAQMSGATPFAVLRRVTLPLMRPALVYGWVWMALLTFRELTIPAILNSRHNQTLAVLVYQQWVTNQTRAAALTVVMVGVMLPFLPLYWRLTQRAGRAGFG